MKTNTSKSRIYLVRIYYPELLQLNKVYKPIKNWQTELPGSPVVKTPHFHCQEPQVQSLGGTRIPQAAQHGQKKKKVKNLNGHFSKQDKQMTNQHMKRCYHQSLEKNAHQNHNGSTYYHWGGYHFLKRKTRIGKDVQKLKLAYITSWNVKWCKSC